jgi:hypothetical protein
MLRVRAAVENLEEVEYIDKSISEPYDGVINNKIYRVTIALGLMKIMLKHFTEYNFLTSCR